MFHRRVIKIPESKADEPVYTEEDERHLRKKVEFKIDTELAMFGIESSSYATIFIMFLKRTFLHTLHAAAKLVLLPVIAVMELGQAAIALYFARRMPTPRLISKAIILGLSAAAVTASVIGHMLFAQGVVTAGTAFLTSALPWVLGGVMVARGLRHLAFAFYHWNQARTLDLSEKTKLNNAARDNLQIAVASILMGVASTLLLVAAVTNPVGLAIMGVVGGAMGVGYAIRKFIEFAWERPKQVILFRHTLQELAPDPTPVGTTSILGALGRREVPDAAAIAEEQPTLSSAAVFVTNQQQPTVRPALPKSSSPNVHERPRPLRQA